MLLQEVAAGGAHPLSNTVAAWMWLLPLLPLAGFVLNGVLALLAGYHRGPADPSASNTHAGAHVDHPHTDDAAHHRPARHRYAALSSIIGPAVLFAAFGLAVSIFG